MKRNEIDMTPYLMKTSYDFNYVSIICLLVCCFVCLFFASASYLLASPLTVVSLGLLVVKVARGRV